MDWRIISPKTWNTILLIALSLLYIGILAILNISATAFIFALIPLIIIIAGVWGYGLKAKFPGAEIDYYPIKSVMQRPSIIMEGKTGKDAEKLMEKERTDFINVVDKNGLFRGIFTRADAHRARIEMRIREKIEEIMTPREKVVSAFEREILRDIIEKVGRSKHSKLPVIDDENKVIGIVDSVEINDLISKMLKRII